MSQLVQLQYLCMENIPICQNQTQFQTFLQQLIKFSYALTTSNVNQPFFHITKNILLKKLTTMMTSYTSQLSILQLKSIIARVKDEINMRTITVAIRQHCIEEQKAYLKEQFLKFFLKCETKIRINHNQEWNRVISNELKKFVGAQNLYEFVYKKLVGSALGKIQIHSLLDEQAKAQELIESQFSPLKDMEISEEVKVKTKYFYKWCLFLEEKRQIQRLKNREVQNLKKAKAFQLYSLKFTIFNQWKMCVKKVKLTQKRALCLENKTRNTQLKHVMSEIKQKIEIINIEKMLADVVITRLVNMQTKAVFGKLLKAKNSAQELGKMIQKKDNIWLYRFYNCISKAGQPLNNKTSIKVRQDNTAKFEHICLQYAWKGIKEQMKQTLKKIDKLKQLIKDNNFLKFRQITKRLKSTASNTYIIKAREKMVHFNELLSSIKDKRAQELDFLNNQEALLKILVTSSFKLMFKRLTQCRSFRIEGRDKKAIYLKNANLNAMKNVLKNMKNKMTKKATILANQKKIQSSWILTLFKQRSLSLRQNKLCISELNQQMSARHHKQLLIYAWKGFKTAKKTKANELQTLSAMSSMLEKKALQITFDSLVQRHQTLKNIQELFKQTQKVALKVSFITILNRMLSKKIKIKAFTTQQNLKTKRKLFQLLEANAELLADQEKKAKLSYVRLIKKELLSNLKKQVTVKETVRSVQLMLEQQAKISFFKRMQSRYDRRIQYQEAQNRVAAEVKGNYLYQFFEAVRGEKQYKETEEKKSAKILRRILRGYAKTLKKHVITFRDEMQANQQKKAQLQKLTKTTQIYLSGTALKQILRKSSAAVERKYQCLRASKVKQMFKLLIFRTNSIKLCKNIQLARAQQALVSLENYSIAKEQRERLGMYIKKHSFARIIRQISNNLLLEKQQLQAKVKEVKLNTLKKRQKHTKEAFITRLKTHFQQKENMMLLLNYRVQQGCKQLVKLYLTKKSAQLKQYVALKHYATTVKRRGLRGWKKNMNMVVFKENRTKTQNHSKILVEKSIDNAKKKSKLMETIERYNMSRISRVVR